MLLKRLPLKHLRRLPRKARHPRLHRLQNRLPHRHRLKFHTGAYCSAYQSARYGTRCRGESACTGQHELRCCPLDLAAGSEEWWSIDSSDSAYWAVQENINAMRAAAGLSPLTMDSGLSAAADARCESFVAGGPFDHSGMTTRSEICAAGPIGSASSVCTYWQGSPAHYANIMEPSFTGMGVGCWFCSTAEGQYTYWTVTFQ